jgi:hypothetical protein
MLKALQQFNARLEALAEEITGLRATVDLQSHHIVELQTELDGLSATRSRFRAVRPPTSIHAYRITAAGRN